MSQKYAVAAVFEERTGVLLADLSERFGGGRKQRFQRVLAFAFLMRFFTLEKASSMGFMSGE